MTDRCANPPIHLNSQGLRDKVRKPNTYTFKEEGDMLVWNTMPQPVIGFHLCRCLATIILSSQSDKKRNEALITVQTCKLPRNRRRGISMEMNGDLSPRNKMMGWDIPQWCTDDHFIKPQCFSLLSTDLMYRTALVKALTRCMKPLTTCRYTSTCLFTPAEVRWIVSHLPPSSSSHNAPWKNTLENN